MRKPFDLTFGVGPTQISKEVKKDMIYAAENNLLSISHRGKEFTEISKNTIDALRDLYNVPENYNIFFTSSATEGWEICARNLVEKEAFSFVCGHFSAAFSKCLTSWGITCHEDAVGWGEINDYKNAKVPESVELVTLCHNETSTGVRATLDDITYLREHYADKLIAIDVTSSIGSAKLNIIDADVWYFSVQKGFGLPSGLGVMFVGPRAMAKSKKMLNKGHLQGFFNFTNMEKQMADGRFQTIPTPNILGIYLLGEQCKRKAKKGIEWINDFTEKRAEELYNFFEKHPDTTPFILDQKHRSPYSLCIHINEDRLTYFKDMAKKQAVELGGGYGPMKADHMRVSNYMAISDKDIKLLQRIFNQ